MTFGHTLTKTHLSRFGKGVTEVMGYITLDIFTKTLPLLHPTKKGELS